MAKATTSKADEKSLQPAEIVDGQLMLTPKHLDLIKKQIAPDATPEELDLFVMMARRTRLDPLLSQLYFVKYKDNRASRERGEDVYNVSYITSVDGYRIIAHRTGDFAGIDEPEYEYDRSGNIVHCTVRVWRKSSDKSFAAKVKFGEYNTGRNLWPKMPETMIAKVAEAHALRKAFPQDLSGVYTSEEMEQAKPAEPVRMVTKEQINLIYRLLDEKNRDVETILTHMKIRSLKELTFKQADNIIKKLQAIRVESSKPPKNEDTGGGSPQNEEIDIDEVDEGINKMKHEPPVEDAEVIEDDEDGEDEEPEIKMATAGDIKLFESVLKRRAKQQKKGYETLLSKFLEKTGKKDLGEFTHDQINQVINKITEKIDDTDFEEDVTEAMT